MTFKLKKRVTIQQNCANDSETNKFFFPVAHGSCLLVLFVCFYLKKKPWFDTAGPRQGDNTIRVMLMIYYYTLLLVRASGEVAFNAWSCASAFLRPDVISAAHSLNKRPPIVSSRRQRSALQTPALAGNVLLIWKNKVLLQVILLYLKQKRRDASLFLKLTYFKHIF